MNNDIGWALTQMRDGKRVTRTGWDGQDMWLALWIVTPSGEMDLPYVYMRTATRDLVPWTCTQMDLLATDWSIAPL
jgi:hypothetical protein